MSWASIVLGGLKILMSIFEYLNSRQLIKAGEDKAIAAAAMELLERTERGKALRERVRLLTLDEENDLWEAMLKWKE